MLFYLYNPFLWPSENSSTGIVINEKVDVDNGSTRVSQGTILNKHTTTEGLGIEVGPWEVISVMVR